MTTSTPSRFRIALVVAFSLAFSWLQFGDKIAPRPATELDWRQDGRLHVFFSPDCPHCHEAIEYLKAERIDHILHDVSKPSSEALLRRVVKHFDLERIGVPLFVFGSRYLIGFESPEGAGRELRALMTDKTAVARRVGDKAPIILPFIGEIDPTHHSLLALTALMGFSDGFNPCAMWVLIYLISLIVTIQDRRKIWWLVGTFVLSSGVLYFLFMTAWLNTFLFIGYVKPLTQLIALLAIAFGLDHLFALTASRGEIVCEVGDLGQRQRTMRWGRELVAAPVGVVSLLLIVALAFTVNAIEFVCSAALPAIYTHMLSLTDLPATQHYAYIALYVTFFMLDDLIIFGFAAFAVQKIIDTRYAALSRGVGGVILIGLGGWMLARG
jgi:glutaredoxin